MFLPIGSLLMYGYPPGHWQACLLGSQGCLQSIGSVMDKIPYSHLTSANRDRTYYSTCYCRQSSVIFRITCTVQTFLEFETKLPFLVHPPSQCRNPPGLQATRSGTPWYLKYPSPCSKPALSAQDLQYVVLGDPALDMEGKLGRLPTRAAREIYPSQWPQPINIIKHNTHDAIRIKGSVRSTIRGHIMLLNLLGNNRLFARHE